MRDDDDDISAKKNKTPVEIGSDLSTWAVGDLDERIAELEEEIGRLRAEKERKQSNLSAAEEFFKFSKQN